MVEVVGLERKGHVALITLNRPEARNALSPEMLVRLADTWTKVRDDPGIRVAVCPSSEVLGQWGFGFSGGLGSSGVDI